MIPIQPRSFLLLAFVAALSGQQNTVRIRPKEIADVLENPGIGIQTFQRYRGKPDKPVPGFDELQAGRPQARKAPDVPLSTVAYIRWYWRMIEPEQGKYRWDILDRALDEARRHGQALALRIMPYDDGRNALPEWFRKSGARRANKPTDTRSIDGVLRQDGDIWSPDPNDPLYIKHWSALVRAMGARYDGHPDLDSVDIATCGYWGESWGPYVPEWQNHKILIDAHLDAFKVTPLLVNIMPYDMLTYAVGKGAGWRLDCWGCMNWPGRPEGHMFDKYPQALGTPELQDAWRRAPVSLETCWVPEYWQKQGWDIKFILDQALRWHASSVNLKSAAIPGEWQAAFDGLLKKLGYRFVLRRLAYPRQVKAGAMMPVEMWFTNDGVAPVYQQYPVAVEIGGAVLRGQTDVRKWLPGDWYLRESLNLEESVKPGMYRFRVAMIDPRTGKPAIRFANEGRQADGWYDLGEITIE